MSSTSPSPSSSPTAVTPNSTSSPPPSDSSAASPPPTVLDSPNATSDAPPPTTSSNSSPPPAQAQAPPPAVTSAPPPVSPSPPPPTPVVTSPEPPTSPPTITPPPPTTPVVDPPSSPPPTPPPPVISPPPPNQAPPPDSTSPPTVTSPPPQEASPPPPAPIASSPPPPAADSPPPTAANSPPPPAPVVSSPPPTAANSPPPPAPVVSSPPPADSSSPLPSSSPPPSLANPPKSPPAPPSLTPPPSTNSPPTTSSPPVNETQRPSSPSPPSLPPTVPPQTNTSSGGSQPIPTQPNEVPTNGSTNPSSGAPDNGTSRGSGGGGIPIGTAVAIGIVAGIVVLSLIGMMVWILRKQKKKVTGYHAGYVMPSPQNSSPVSESYTKAYSSAPLIGNGSGSGFVYSPTESGGLGNSRTCFMYEELVGVTNGFSAHNLLGEGGFGCVYKGILADGREVAVKQLRVGGSQGEREFTAEVETISRVHHRHLVSLVGYCMSDHQRLLVYDYVPNNTLYYHLHEGTLVMDWATRLKVAIGAARGISYLHEDCHPRIIHRDIKSSNILLDNNFDAQVSDFGLAKLALDVTHVTTRVMGTFGYMAPEYASSGKLTEKSDVYSFGVVLLELITGRKSVDTSQPLGDENLVEWARPLMSRTIDSRELDGLIDPKLENYAESEVFRMIEAAAACVRHSAVKRPRMGQVVRALDGITDSSDLTNGIRPGQSEVFNSAQQSAEIRMFQRMAFGGQDYSSDMFSRNSWGESQRLS